MVWRFFDAVKADDWETATNLAGRINQASGRYRGTERDGPDQRRNDARDREQQRETEQHPDAAPREPKPRNGVADHAGAAARARSALRRNPNLGITTLP